MSELNIVLEKLSFLLRWLFNYFMSCRTVISEGPGGVMSPPSVTSDCTQLDISLGKVSVFQKGAWSAPHGPGFWLSSSLCTAPPQTSRAKLPSHQQTLQQELPAVCVVCWAERLSCPFSCCVWHSLSLARFSCTLSLSLVLNNFYKLLLISNMSLLTKAYAHLPFCHVYVSTLFMESLQKVQYFL